VSIDYEAEMLKLSIEDWGKGIGAEKQSQFTSAGHTGVGIRGMRERVRQLGGSLQIDSNGNGTRVVARFPIPDRSSANND